MRGFFRFAQSGAGMAALGLASAANFATAQTDPVQLAVAGTTIVVNNLNDVALGTWSGVGQLRRNENFCVGTSVNPHRYRITATGSGTAGAFTIGNGVTALPYTLEFRDNGGGFATLTSGVALTNQFGGTIAFCTGGGQNARLRITFQEADLLTGTAGSYSGTIVLLVAPE